MPKDMNTLLNTMIDKGASDLHITAKWPAHIRVDEKLFAVDDHILSPEETKSLVYSLLSKQQIEKFERDFELDVAFELAEISRFRINVFKQRSTVGASIRLIPYKIWSFQECGLPENVVVNLCRRPKGLVLFTGATGSGKSTSLASMIDWINKERACHIITIEDPIEFVHQNKKALIDQREIYSDTHTFPAALKHVLRQDPDVILIGEMRDLETIESALIIAETGHLVFATLHTSDCVQTINRIVDVFPSHQQQQIRTQLSFVLLGVMSQQLIPRHDGKGRVLAIEILLANPAVRSLVRESKIHQLYSTMQTSQREGMKTMNQSLYELYQKKDISYEDAISRSTDPEDLMRLFKR